MTAEGAAKTLEIPPAVPLAAPRPPLAAGEVHLWAAELAGPADPARLSIDERERAERFKLPAARERFVRSRQLLRTILAGYAGDELRFEVTTQGKPFLVGPGGIRSEFQFNLSHTGDLWMLAIARDRQVGIDIERLGRPVDVERLAARLFSARERETLRALSGDRQIAAFLRTWASREAIVKAVGEGMFSHAGRFEVEADPERPLAAWAADGGHWPWRIGLVPGPPDRVCVLAVEGEPDAIRSWRLRAGSAGP